MAHDDSVVSPIGTPVEAASQRRAARSEAYRAQRAAREGYREVAWLLIRYRMDHDLTQQQLADLVGTSHSQISRIESGRHSTNVDTLLRIARALDLKLLIGFESAGDDGPSSRHLVSLT
jgi:DNA-binding XRE family transcriptional regulator